LIKKKNDEKFKSNNFENIIKYDIAFLKKKCLVEMKVNKGDIKEYEV